MQLYHLQTFGMVKVGWSVAFIINQWYITKIYIPSTDIVYIKKTVKARLIYIKSSAVKTRYKGFWENVHFIMLLSSGQKYDPFAII